jgi:hypothetical protein
MLHCFGFDTPAELPAPEFDTGAEPGRGGNAADQHTPDEIERVH